MSNDESGLERRLVEVERRLEALERAGSADASGTTDTASTANAGPSSLASDLRRAQAASIAGVEADAQSPMDGPPAPANLPPPARVAAPAQRKKPKVPREAMSLEQFIGGRSFLVLGALIVVAGVGFFLKMAWDAGLLGRIPPVWRCGLSGSLGVALLVCGELLRNRFGERGAAGFFAAGLGVLYAAAWATFGIFGLVDVSVGFVMLASVSLLGLAAAVRSSSAWVGGLALVGGYMAPVVIDEPAVSVWALPTYLLVLLSLASVLSVVARNQRVLASLAWWGTGVLGTLWFFADGIDAPMASLVFVVGSWAVAHWCRIVHAVSDVGRVKNSLAAVGSFTTTVWAVGLALMLADRHGVPTWIASASFGVVTLLLGLWLGRGKRVLVEVASNSKEGMGTALVAQAGALVMLSVPLAFEAAWTNSAVWLVLGVGALVGAARSRAIGLAWYGAVLLAAATARLGMMVAFDDALYIEGVDRFGLVWSGWMALMAGAGAAWLLGGWCAHDLSRDGVRSAPAIRSLSLMAGFLVIAAMVLHERATSEGVLLGWSVLGASALGLALWLRALRLQMASTAFAMLASGAWSMSFLYLTGWSDRASGEPAFLHAGMMWSLALAAWWGVLAWRATKLEPEARRASLALSCSSLGALLLISTTLEVARVAGMLTSDVTARAGSVSVWWSLVGVGVLVGGVVRRLPVLRWCGIGLLLLATGKVLTYDLAELSSAVRVGSFMVMGLVLLGVAAGYLKVAKAKSEVGGQQDASGEGDTET